jgi:hypothetical protein
VNNLLDDAEIQLRVIARQRPGSERRCAPCCCTIVLGIALSCCQGLQPQPTHRLVS